MPPKMLSETLETCAMRVGIRSSLPSFPWQDGSAHEHVFLPRLLLVAALGKGVGVVLFLSAVLEKPV